MNSGQSSGILLNRNTNHDNDIDWLGSEHFLRIYRHQISEVHGGRVREGFVEGYGRKAHRQPPGDLDPSLNRFHKVTHITMTRIEGRGRVDDADDWAI
jgi:hypothetical protein